MDGALWRGSAGGITIYVDRHHRVMLDIYSPTAVLDVDALCETIEEAKAFADALPWE